MVWFMVDTILFATLNLYGIKFLYREQKLYLLKGQCDGDWSVGRYCLGTKEMEKKETIRYSHNSYPHTV